MDQQNNSFIFLIVRLVASLLEVERLKLGMALFGIKLMGIASLGLSLMGIASLGMLLIGMPLVYKKFWSLS